MIGEKIGGKYEIVKRIGTGGTADVYKARCLDDKNTFVAIKVLKAEHQDNAEYVRRFGREAQACMKLRHKNIVKLIGTGVENGASYIVFEYIDGPTLKDYILEQGKFEPKRAASIIGNILDAIGYAHSEGIIHRDVKPQNIMITSDGEVKLADFGIARLTNATTKSFYGTKIIGSVHYISPEQAAGKEATAQSDLYSVGIILYEMLTGTLPYECENEASLALMHMTSKMQPPIERNPEISHAMNAVILKATAKSIDIRYKSAKEMKDDLNRALKDPNGKFADIADTDETAETEDTKPQTIAGLNRGVFNTLIVLVSCIAVMIIAFLIVQATYKPVVTVQSIVGKTVDEAEKIFGKDLDIEVAYESSDKNPGYIISQEPISGARVQKGTKVKVVVSIGSESTIAPDLKELSLPDAYTLLADKGLGIEKVIYRDDSQIEAGLVCDQSPKAGDTVDVNSRITVYISGTPEMIAEIPDLSNMSIDEAVEKLNAQGFMQIFVRYVADTGTPVGNVVSQELDAGLEIDASIPIELSISGTHGSAKSDCAYNITVEKPSESVLITVDTGKGYQIVVYEKKDAPEGVLTASFTAYVDEAGTYECIVYKSGVEYKRSEINCTVKE